MACDTTDSKEKRVSERDDGLKIYLENGEIIIQGTIDLGYIGTFKDTQIEITDTLEEIREWDIIEEYYTPIARTKNLSIT